MNRPKLRLLLPAAFFLLTASAFADTIFTDNTFNLADYSVTGPFKSDSASAVAFGQCTSCGNPGDGLQIVMGLPTGDDLIALGFVNSNFSYNPQTQGAITSLDASVDKNFTANLDETGAGNTFRPLIEQDGIFYMAAIPGPTVTGTTTGYNTIAGSGLTASAFLDFDFTTGQFGTTSPNFAGDPMLFGLGQISQFTADGVVFEADYDNLSIGISSVPEPSELRQIGLLAAVLATLAIARRRRLIQ
jgi:hypothetical protein